MTLSQAEAEKLALQMARAIWKQMNFRGGDPTREWDSLTPDMQQPILDSCRVGLEAVRREIENAAYRRTAIQFDRLGCVEAAKTCRALITPAKTADTEG